MKEGVEQAGAGAGLFNAFVWVVSMGCRIGSSGRLALQLVYQLAFDVGIE